MMVRREPAAAAAAAAALRSRGNVRVGGKSRSSTRMSGKPGKSALGEKGWASRLQASRLWASWAAHELICLWGKKGFPFPVAALPEIH